MCRYELTYTSWSERARSGFKYFFTVFIAIAALAGAGRADAAVAVLQQFPATPQLNGTTGNLSGTFTISAGANRLLVVAVDCQDTGGSAGQTFSATYGGRAFTQAIVKLAQAQKP